jgi:hypothetical protein
MHLITKKWKNFAHINSLWIQDDPKKTPHFSSISQEVKHNSNGVCN